MLNLDCPDPRVEATFWSELLGWEIVMVEDEYAMLKGTDGALLGFGKVPDYVPPTWPNEHGSKQFHLDLKTGDIAAAEQRCRRSRGDLARRAARRDLAGAARSGGPSVLPHRRGELGLSRSPCLDRVAPPSVPLVAGDDHTGAGDHAADQPELGQRRGLVEQPGSLPEHQRVDQTARTGRSARRRAATGRARRCRRSPGPVRRSPSGQSPTSTASPASSTEFCQAVRIVEGGGDHVLADRVQVRGERVAVARREPRRR